MVHLGVDRVKHFSERMFCYSRIMSTSTEARPSKARDRLLGVAAEIFYREGIHGVGVERVLDEAGVTRTTLYRHFDGKEALVAAYLGREDATIRGYFAAASEQAPDPESYLTMIVQGIADDVARYHTRGCPFINAAAEYPDANSEVRGIIAAHRSWFRATLRDALAGAGHAHPEDAAASLVLLRDAALVGGYLDGVDVAGPAFLREASAVIAR